MDVVVDPRFEIVRMPERADQTGAVRVRLFHHHRDRDMARIQRHTVAEQQQQHQRHHERDRDARRVAQDLQRFFAHHAAQAHARRVHAAASAPDFDSA